MFLQLGGARKLLRIRHIDSGIMRAARLGGQMVLRGVDRDPIHPRIERAFAAKPRERAVCLQKCLLCDIEHFGRILDVTGDELGDPMLILEHQQIEGLALSPLYPLHERAV